MDKELLEKLKTHHSEEVKDKESYEELAKELKSSGHSRAAGIVCDIAHDEHTHAQALAMILEQEGIL